MDFSSLPKYRVVQTAGSAAGAQNTSQRISQRAMRNLRDLALLVAIVALLYWLRQTVAAIEHAPVFTPAPLPLDFRLVEQRYGDVPLMGSRKDVERLLGTPTQRNAWHPELAETQRRLEIGDRNSRFLPRVRAWDIWSDPKNESRWVAILYVGDYRADRTYLKLKKGF